MSGRRPLPARITTVQHLEDHAAEQVLDAWRLRWETGTTTDVFPLAQPGEMRASELTTVLVRECVPSEENER